MGEIRLIISDNQWEVIEKILKKVKRPDGRPPWLSNRMFIEAILYVARTGLPWRDLPKSFGYWNAVYNRFRRWEENGVWQGLWKELRRDEFKEAAMIFIDSTIIRAHQHAAGAGKKTADKRLRDWGVHGVG